MKETISNKKNNYKKFIPKSRKSIREILTEKFTEKPKSKSFSESFYEAWIANKLAVKKLGYEVFEAKSRKHTQARVAAVIILTFIILALSLICFLECCRTSAKTHPTNK